MKSIFLAAIFAASYEVSQAASLKEARSNPGSHTLSIKYEKEKSNTHLIPEYTLARMAKRSLKKRQDSAFIQDLDNNQLLYFANVSLGNPPQDVRLQIDSGSSDVWVLYSESDFCLEGNCNEGGSYNPDESDSFNLISVDNFEISYVDSTSAKGDYFSDDFRVGGRTIKDQQMGISRKTDIPIGIMGIGYSINEAIVGQGGERYPSMIEQLVAQNLIKAKAYSIWLNDLDANTGEILFGGIDTEKYQGKLYGLDLQRASDEEEFAEFAVALTGLSMSDNNGKSQDLDTNGDLPIAAVLDTGSSFTVLPDDLADNCAAVVRAVFNKDLQLYQADCSLSSSSELTYDFKFGNNNGPVIRVPLNEMIHPAKNTDGTDVEDENGDTICTLGIIRAGDLADKSYLFGDTFLRSAYVVFDLEDNRVYIAPTVFNTTKSDIVEIQSEADGGVPDVAEIVTGVNVQTNGKGGAVHGGDPRGAGSLNFAVQLPILFLTSVLAAFSFLLI